MAGLAALSPVLGEAGIWLTPVFAEGIFALLAMALFVRWMGWTAQRRPALNAAK
jgi:hypothetical protein